MNWDRVNVWTNTFYTLIHSLQLSKQVNFGNLEYLSESVKQAASWISPDCSYQSVLAAHPFGGREPVFRRDPNKHFESISAQVVKMLVQDLVVIFDEMMAESLATHGQSPSNYPQGKVQQLRAFLNTRYSWSADGCMELIAVRNVLAHANSRWNQQSINIISTCVQPLPSVGDELVIGVPMLFRYRKAIRTFLNETRL